jgi:xylulokinase
MSSLWTTSVVSIHVARQARGIMYLGIDLGTSAVKTILVDHEQRVAASRSQSLTVASPHPGYSEQDPGQWIDATFATLDALKAAHPRDLAAVDGIGLELFHAAITPLEPRA